MTRSIIFFAIAAVFFCSSRPVDACGYGLLDPDVETFCSGDPNQAAKALVNLVKRGPTAMKAIERYRDLAVMQNASYERFLVRLKNNDSNLNMPPELIEKEILRTENWLQWNQTRLQKIDYLLFRFGGVASLSHRFRIDVSLQ